MCVMGSCLEGFQIVSPSAKMGDVLCAADGVGFNDEPLHFFAVFKFEGADAERRGNKFDEAAEFRIGNFPDFDFNSAGGAFIGADKAGFRRSGVGKGEQQVAGRGSGGAHEGGVAFDKLAVKRLPAEMCADDCKFHTIAPFVPA